MAGMMQRIKDALGLGLSRHYSSATLRDRNRVRWYAVQDFFSRRWYRCESAIARRRAKARGTEFMCGRRTEGYSSKFSTGPDYWRFDGTCNYCGSLSPEQFFKAIEDGCEIGPTDKSYKVYINGEKAPVVRGAGKFYFQHLTEAGQRKFIAFLNAKKIKIGYPGHFYVTPFFIAAPFKTVEDQPRPN